jgi:hypothetical protein
MEKTWLDKKSREKEELSVWSWAVGADVASHAQRHRVPRGQWAVEERPAGVPALRDGGSNVRRRFV